ncbi:MAG: ATP-binding protein [Nanoarchaeota archaeon]
MTKEGYTGKDIQVLEGLEGVRRRPSMYIGSTSKEGLHHLIYEAVDNSVDEALAGVCKNITVSINKDGSATIEDDGRGIPVDMHPQYKVPAVQIALTKLHAGGKFDKKSYEISGGLHGVGISVVNALSKKLIAEIKRDGKIYRQEYSRGEVKTKLEVTGKYNGDATGTTVTFWPDEIIFSTVNFDYKVLETRFREITFLNPGLKIILIDEIKGKKQEFFSSGGLIEFVKWMNDSKEVLHKPIYFKKDIDKTIIEVAIQYNNGYQENIFGFVNTINTVEGGTHVSGFKTAVTRVINDYAKKTGMLKNGNGEESLTGEDVREGLTAIISIKIAEPQFEGQTKTKLGNSEVKGFVDSAVTASLSEFFEENPPIAKKITLKSLESAKARLAAKKAKDLIRRKNAFSLGGLPGKLADCSSKKTENTEVYIVEGESAGGCFSGDTKVALADGRNLSFKQLVNEHNEGKENFCYTIKEDGDIAIEKIENPRLTKENAEVIKIILDNDEEIICTPDHKFMLRNGSYKEAKDLIKKDSLMPLRKKISKIKRIELLNQKIDVYDIEVPKTHNFALASGVFVHNSAKMARDKENQAILPLKGKILNVEKSSPIKALSSEEITNMITVIGTGVGDQFNPENLRYGRIIIMSVDGEEATFVQNNRGIISFVKIGDFIDGLAEKEINPSKYKVLCFNLKTRRTQFKEIKSVIRHPITEKLYEIKTSYGRNVKVTSSHSVFVFEDGRIKLKKGNEIKKGDKIVAPKSVPLYNYNLNSSIDVLSVFVENKEKINGNIYVRGKTVEGMIRNRIKEIYKDNNELVDNRIIISEELGNIMAEKRREIEISQKELCKKICIKQPCIYYDWEKGKSKPSFKNFEKYINVLGINKEQALLQVQIVSSKLDSIWEKQYKNSGRNRLRDYIKLKEVNQEDLVSIGEDVKLCPVHYKNMGINRFIPINNNLAKLIGFWVAEGSCSLRNGIRMSIGNNDLFLVPEFKEAFVDVFDLNAKLTKFNRNSAELKLVNRVASLFWKCLFGFETYSSHTKKIPNIIFNISKELQLEFLRGYFLGDGTISKNGISFTTVSKDLANQLMYLLLSHGVISGMSCREPSENKKIISKEKVYTVSVTSKNGLLALKRVWESHRNSYYLKDKLNRKSYLFNKSFLEISDDLIALEVKDCEEVKPSNGQVYDFSVDEDENFIAGFGGLCCHNTDADVDGEHIKTLLLTFFFRFMPQLIENGNIHVALPPLYRIRKGQKDIYVYTDEELKKAASESGVTEGGVTRFKGLGEMNSQQLWDTTMNPKTRKLKKIFIEDAIEADKVFSMLMGDDVPARKQFIQENAKEAQLDI